MVMSVERVYARQTPKSITGSELMFKKSANPMTGEDILGLLGQIQHREPIGALILDAQIAQDKTARARLVGALQATLAAMGKSDDLAYSMAEAAVHEVVDCNVCLKCKGTGIVFSRKFAKNFECSRCSGVGRIIKTHKEILSSLNSMLSEQNQVTQQHWKESIYDQYMDAVNCLHEQAGRAARMAKQLLSKVADEGACL